MSQQQFWFQDEDNPPEQSIGPALGLLEMDVGGLGGGKTTRAAWRVLDFKQRFPWIPRVGNVQMDDIMFQSDIMKFLAVKFVHDGNKPGPERTPMLIIVDEANTSGLESRGSGATPGETTVLQFVRKLNIYCILISQLMSMTDRRGQWLAHFYVLCKALYDQRKKSLVDAFEYKIYDEAYRYQKTEYLGGAFARDWIFPRFDTWGIPNYDKIALELIRRHQLNTDDFEDYSRIVNFYTGRSVTATKQDKWFAGKWNQFWESTEKPFPEFKPRDLNQEMPKPKPRESNAANLLKG